QQLRIVNGTVMVDLPPSLAVKPKHSCGPDFHLQPLPLLFYEAALPANHIKDLVESMKSVIVELEMIRAVHLKKPFVYSHDLVPATFNSSERVVHGRLIGCVPILFHEFEIT